MYVWNADVWKFVDFVLNLKILTQYYFVSLHQNQVEQTSETIYKRKHVKWLMVMLKMQRENYMVIHAVLSRSLTFYLQPNKLELLGDLDSVEDQCQQDVC